MKIQPYADKPPIEVGNPDPMQRDHTEAVLAALLAEELDLPEEAIWVNADPKNVYPGDGAYIVVSIRYPEVIE